MAKARYLVSSGGGEEIYIYIHTHIHTHDLKIESYVLLSRQNWRLKPRTPHLLSLWETVPKRKGYMGVFQRRPNTCKIKRLLLIKKRNIYLKEFIAFLYTKDGRVWNHWNPSFDMPLSYPGPGSCPFSPWVFSGCFVRSGCSSWLPGGRHPTGTTVIWWPDGCNIPCLLMQQAIFFTHPGVDTFIYQCVHWITAFVCVRDCGHHPYHWSSASNFSSALQFLLENGIQLYISVHFCMISQVFELLSASFHVPCLLGGSLTTDFFYRWFCHPVYCHFHFWCYKFPFGRDLPYLSLHPQQLLGTSVIFFNMTP